MLGMAAVHHVGCRVEVYQDEQGLRLVQAREVEEVWVLCDIVN